MSLWLAILALNFLHATASQYDDHCHPYACEFGECIPEGSSFRCKCQYDHVGPACNIWRSPLVNCDVDGPLSCLNGGVCNATENKFRCECPPNFTGLFCETDVDECSISPCYNGATCVNQIGSFHCICPPGYKGAICEDPVEICSSRTCLNGGSCIDGVNGYVCQCPPGFTGQRCQEVRTVHFSGNSAVQDDVPAVCAGCSFKAGNAQCDRECDRQECGYDGGDCMAQERDPFIACASAEYCARVFHDGVCDEICDTEWCLFDGFDCVPKAPKCPSGCEVKARNGFCDEECNREECDFDGGDCEVAARILSGELSIVVLAKPHYFVDNVQHFVHSLSKSLRSDIHIKRDELGLMAFVWKNGEVGKRLHFGKQFASADLDTSAYSAEREGVIVWIEVDVSKCVKDCFSDIEIVASFIEADKKELLEAMNMSIYSAVAEKPKKRPNHFGITLLFIVVCISLMILIALLLVIQQKGSRKRKVVQNAPVWMPPTEFISKKGEEFTKEMSRSDITALESAKRRRLDPEEIKLLEQKMTPNFPRVRVEAKPKKLEPQPSKLHVEAASSDPISSLSNCEEVNRRGPYGRTPLMVLVRNSLKTEEQLIDEITRLHAAGADLDLCDDYDDTALHMAVSSGRVAVVRKLLQLGACPVIRDRTNSTCLHLAARVCAPSIVKALLENERMRAEVDALDDENRTALMLVAMHDMVDTKIAEMLCDAGAKVNCDGDNSLTTWKGRTALHFAAKYNNPQMVAFLLERNANKDCQDYECCTPLHLAASEGHVGPVKELLKAGASVMLRNDKSQTPYDAALVKNSKDVAALLASGDNLRVQLYSNNGEIFASSSSPNFKCAKVLMARHQRNSHSLHSSLGSPRSTHSTPTRYPVPSPYEHAGTPQSIAALGSNYSSPQYPSNVKNLADNSVPSPLCLQSSGYSIHGHQPVCGNAVPTSNVVRSPLCIERQMLSVLAEKIATSPAFFDSGFGTMIDRSGPWSGNEEFAKSNDRFDSAHEWLVSNDGYIV